MPFINLYLCINCYRKPHAPNRRFYNFYLIRIVFNERVIINDSNKLKNSVTVSEMHDFPSPKLILILSLPYLGHRFQQFQRRDNL
jgi:hypothetical protein